ncbi:MAG: P-loop NTPase fold protein, partial [Actinomycetota bacterium]|nr:P-loop NTPase fold protein [Actinomycetota bacterium]
MAPLGEPLTGHTDWVRWGAWAVVEGRPVLATGGNDGTVRLWDPIAQAPLGGLLTGHTDWVLWGAWAVVAGRPVLATGSDDGTVRLWDPSTRAPLGEPLTGHTGSVGWGAWAVVAGRPVLATGGGDDNTVRLWEVQQERAVSRLPRYRFDDTADQDQLDRTVEAAALAELITARSAKPPLAVGLFGDWGEGKSHFLRLLGEQVSTSAARHDELAHDAARQVRFNAWHYAETDLWASLVAEVFTQLASPPGSGEDGDVGREQRRQSRLAAELVAERKLAERLDAARARRDQLRHAADTKAGSGLLSVQQRAELHDAARGVDPALVAHVDALVEAGAGSGRWLRVMLIQTARLVRALPRWWLLAALLVVAALVGVSVELLPWLARLASAAGLIGLLGLATAVYTAYRTAIAGVADRVKTVLAMARRMAQAQRDHVQTALRVADAEVAALQRQLDDVTAAGQLAGLVADRATDGGYRRNLGLMTHIREDFQRMAELLSRADQPATAHGGGDATDAAGDELPRIDRIVLYIDDLDRCPPARVVELLEAVHLLLAVPLFVVVVAVDPRWLLRAVAVHYQDLLEPPAPPELGAAGDGVGPEVDPDDDELWASTPAQYLEKIFQVVFTLPPLTTTGYTSMLDTLVAVRADEPPPDGPTITTATGDPSDTRVDGGAEHLVGAAPDDENDRWDSAVPLPAARVVERVDPLALRADEHQLMRLLGPPLITTPRAVKRLANSYGLLAAIRRHRSPDQPNPQAGLTGGGGDSDDVLDRPAMVLLAALIGFPSLGPALFTHLHHTAAVRPSCTWPEFLTPEPIVGGWCNPADPRLTPVQERNWRALLAALTQLTHHAENVGIPLPEPLPAWARWVIPVGRLSFPTGRVVSDLDRPPPTTRRPPQATPNGTVHPPGSQEGPRARPPPNPDHDIRATPHP